MKDNFARVLDHILEREGGFSDHPRDPGGATNMGITIGTLGDWRGRAVTAADVRALRMSEATEIYRAWYWQPIRGDDLPAGVDLVVFDHAVNAGVQRAVKMLQTAVGATPDGMIGPKTLAAVRAADPVRLVEALSWARVRHYLGLPTFAAFGKGWIIRAEATRADAVGMTGG